MLSKVLYFAVGAALGSAATYYVVKRKYEELANQERIEREEYYKQKEELIDLGESMSQGFTDGLKGLGKDPDTKAKYEEITSTYTSQEDAKGDDILKYYRERVKEHEKEREKEEENVGERPYVISPEEFGEVGYKTVSLTYYANGVLADEHDKEIGEDGIERLVGMESLNHFGEYEDDSVFVRNDKLHTDFEILKDLDDYYGG